MLSQVLRGDLPVAALGYGIYMESSGAEGLDCQLPDLGAAHLHPTPPLAVGSAFISKNKSQVFFSPSLTYVQKGKCVFSSSNSDLLGDQISSKKLGQNSGHFLFLSGVKWAQLKWAPHEHPDCLLVWTKCSVWGQPPSPEGESEPSTSSRPSIQIRGMSVWGQAFWETALPTGD